MRWSEVHKFAEDNGLEIYSPYGGYHRNLQIIDRTDDLIISILFLGAINYCQLLKAIATHQRTYRHWWTNNKAKDAYQSLLSIVQQEQLAKLTDEQAIAASQEAKSFF